MDLGAPFAAELFALIAPHIPCRSLTLHACMPAHIDLILQHCTTLVTLRLHGQTDSNVPLQNLTLLTRLVSVELQKGLQGMARPPPLFPRQPPLPPLRIYVGIE